MTKKLLFVVTIALALSIVAFAADVTGKWTYEQPGRGGNPGPPVTITLKQDGAKLTGEVPGMGRGGDNPPPPTAITDGKVDGNMISLEQADGQSLVATITASISFLSRISR